MTRVFPSFSCLICCPETHPQCRFLRQDVTVHGGFKSDQCKVLTKDTIKEENNTFKRKQEAWGKISISFITKLIIESCAVTHYLSAKTLYTVATSTDSTLAISFRFFSLQTCHCTGFSTGEIWKTMRMIVIKMTEL